jgi:hypothetical protein
MTEIYWITRLDAISSFFGMVMIFSFLGLIVLLLFTLFGEIFKEEIKKYVKGIKMLTIPFVIGFLGCVFIPTTNEVMLMYGLGTIKEYVDNNEKAKELPDKAIDALNKYLDEINESKDSTK